MPATPGDDDAPLLTRRRALTGIGTAAVGGLGLAIWPTDTASAQVSMGELNVSGDSATVDGPPERIDVHVTGEFAIDAASVPEMTKIILQLHVGGLNDRVDDVAETSAFGAASGSFEIAADLYDHREVARGDLMPADPGASKTTPVVVRVICQAIDGGKLLAEDYVQDTVDLVLTMDGLEVRVGGSGDLEVVAA